MFNGRKRGSNMASHRPEGGSEARAQSFLGLLTSSDFMRDTRVVGGMPSRAAAPSAPKILPAGHFQRRFDVFAISPPSLGLVHDCGSLGGIDADLRGAQCTFACRKVNPEPAVRARIAARSITFSSSRTLPGQS